MSAIIKQIREQAWVEVSKEERERGELYEARELWERCDKKFAELILKECMKLNHDNFHDEDPYSIDAIYRQHFGVKE